MHLRPGRAREAYRRGGGGRRKEGGGTGKGRGREKKEKEGKGRGLEKGKEVRVAPPKRQAWIRLWQFARIGLLTNSR